MAFDACMMRAVLFELKEKLIGAKIEKVQQPTNDEINLILHSERRSLRLVLNVGPSSPRIQLSELARENPIAAPMFCMYLRKHIGGGKIEKIEQLGFDRIALFKISAYDEMGFVVERTLVCEIMGKYANLILLDENEKIMNALKIVDFSDSAVRQVMPGLKYQIPETKARLSPIEINKTAFLSKFESFEKEKSIEKFITQSYSGVSTQIAREIAFRASKRLDCPLGLIDAERLYSEILKWQELLISHGYTPRLTFDFENAPIDYSYMKMTHLENGDNYKDFDTLYSLFDAYFFEKDRLEKIRHRASDLIRLLQNAISRTERKLVLQKEEILSAKTGEEYKKNGDLITANIYKIKRGDPFVLAVDYYAENAPEIKIELDTRLSPAQNAQRYYKLYAKSKKAKEVLGQQILIWEKELKYLYSVNDALTRAETEEELLQIREELSSSGYGAKKTGYKPPRVEKSRFIEYKTTDGLRVLVGKNNLQNDYLTTRLADKEDIWFHVKDFHGSHTVLFTEGKEPSDRDYVEAAEIAAYHSEIKGGSVSVDYTKIKNIKKPQGSRPGFVTYKTNYSMLVTKKLPTEEKK